MKDPKLIIEYVKYKRTCFVIFQLISNENGEEKKIIESQFPFTFHYFIL